MIQINSSPRILLHRCPLVAGCIRLDNHRSVAGQEEPVLGAASRRHPRSQSMSSLSTSVQSSDTTSCHFVCDRTIIRLVCSISHPSFCQGENKNFSHRQASSKPQE